VTASEKLIPVALTIAGSDSGGGAGIQADLKTFHAFGVFGTSAITALTAQNTLGVRAVHAVPAAMVQAQIRAVADDLAPAACKSGMLASRDIILAVADSIRDLGLRPYVLDPVMVATSGDRLLDEGAEAALAEALLPLCTVVTPNLDEAAALTGRSVRDEAEMRAAAKALVAMGARAALVKGGHLAGGAVVDVLFDGAGFRTWTRPRIETRSTHGTGCTLSAAIAAGFARGGDLGRAVEDALDFVHRAIARAPRLGSGNGPLNHFVPAPAGPADPPGSTSAPR
jgi:hydroxymethylpyrimidine/phosphomethylpyrimidine kinase